MAWRIDGHLIRGEIDNRTLGRVTGRLWFTGRAEIVALDLSGNCHPDLAGCLLCFENPNPQPGGDLENFAAEQRGAAGDITASRKVRVLEIPLPEALHRWETGEPVPEHTGNSVYIEWFSEANGRVVIESSEFTTTITEPAWRLTPEAAAEQAAASQRAMADLIEKCAEAVEAAQDAGDDEGPLDEFGYEKLMRESDAQTDKMMELMDKYADHPDRGKLIAREMGWAWLEDAPEEKPECQDAPDDEDAEPAKEPEPDPLREGVDWQRDKDGRIQHPLVIRSHESAIAMHLYCQEQGFFPEDGRPWESDLHEMVFQHECATAKLAGALIGIAMGGHRPEPGLTVATLKRALHSMHSAIAAADRAAARALLPPEEFDAYHDGLFSIREEILTLMQRFRS